MMIGMSAASGGGPRAFGPLLGILGIALVVCGLVILIWWLRLVRGLRDAITARL